MANSRAKEPLLGLGAREKAVVHGALNSWNCETQTWEGKKILLSTCKPSDGAVLKAVELACERWWCYADLYPSSAPASAIAEQLYPLKPDALLEHRFTWLFMPTLRSALSRQRRLGYLQYTEGKELRDWYGCKIHGVAGLWTVTIEGDEYLAALDSGEIEA